MTELTIDRLVTQAEVRGADDEARVRRLVAGVADRELELALAAVTVPDGLWCLRRLEVGLELDERGDRELGRSWARAVVDALLHDLSDAGPAGSSDLVRYSRPDQVVADLVAELAAGRTQRAWAWRTLNAVAGADPDPETDARGAALAALGHRPHTIVAVLADALAVAGLAPVHRLLGAAGWRQVATWVLAATGEAAGPWLAEDSSRPSDPEGSSRAAAVVRRSRIARSWQRSGVVLDPDVAKAVALLVVAEAEPALLRRPDAALLHRVVRAGQPRPADAGGGLVVPRDLETRESAEQTEPTKPTVPTELTEPTEPTVPTEPTERTEPTDWTEPTRTRAGRVADQDRARGADGQPEPPSRALDPEPDPAEDQDDEATALDGEPAALDGEPTALGGVAYLLATAEAAGVPDALVTDPALATRLPSALLHRLLVQMTGLDPREDDPALRALSGVARDEQVDPGREARRALARLARRWRQETADRLETTEDPREAVLGLVRRYGRVVVVPGWVTFHLRLADVDLDVRRAGLDLDPGFVPWLGSVVVIRYE